MAVTVLHDEYFPSLVKLWFMARSIAVGAGEIVSNDPKDRKEGHGVASFCAVAPKRQTAPPGSVITVMDHS